MEGKVTTPWEIQAGLPKGSVLFSTLYSLFISDTPQTIGINLALFVDDTCIYTIDRKEGYTSILRTLQCALATLGSSCEHWNIKIDEDSGHLVLSTRWCRPVEVHLTFKGRNIHTFEIRVKYLGVIPDKKITMENSHRDDRLQGLRNISLCLLPFQK